MQSSKRHDDAVESPERKRPTNDAELGFVRRPMVRWLDPHQLLDTSARVLASGFTTSYTDSRELQALIPGEVLDRSDGQELWLDYASDLGDGFNSTYTVASLLARPHLELHSETRVHRTERGALLVLGGDQVYPVPTRREYDNRFLGPYRAALPCAPPGGAPELLAIPGSHDWYDGLVNFSSIFCRRRRIGGWQTNQARSYFAVRLPHRWWLWGIDLQFGDYLDEAQVAYFAEATASHVQAGDRIVVCLAKEVESGRKGTEVCSDRNLAHLEREVVAPAGGRVMLYLKSGRHYYARYEADGGSPQLVTAGGGGSFLHPTHALPEIATPPGDEAAGPYRRAEVYPSARWSRRLRWRIWLLPAYNLPLAGVLGMIQVLLVFMLNLHLDDRHRDIGFADLLPALWESPIAFLLMILIIGSLVAMIRLAHDARGVPRLVIGLAHSALQFAGLGLVLVVSSSLASRLEGTASLLVFLGLVWGLGGLGGILGVSGYLWTTNCFGFHANEAYAPLHHMDQKNFLRLHIDADGILTLFPVGIERVGRRWRFRPEVSAHEPWLSPADRQDLRAHLIEPPIRLGRREED